MPFGVHKQIARQTDNPFVWPTTSRGRKLGCGGIRDVYADHGEIAVCELPDVRATATADGLCSILVRVGADAFKKCELCIHTNTTIKEAPRKGKLKTSYSWFMFGASIGYAANRGSASRKSQITRPSYSQLSQESKNDPRTIRRIGGLEPEIHWRS